MGEKGVPIGRGSRLPGRTEGRRVPGIRAPAQTRDGKEWGPSGTASRSGLPQQVGALLWGCRGKRGRPGYWHWRGHKLKDASRHPYHLVGPRHVRPTPWSQVQREATASSRQSPALTCVCPEGASRLGVASVLGPSFT